ncbi:AraC family transcriptional regulator [Microvirga sp. 17 mud 1-3]|uniref:AraC family transcriptional regulator n=1 Tax=Microvirga sp. 17 mud 1-3 TaxID=2082949 RepID=UPI000D6C36CA|nr:AraC family transcriptional regulator [Microvirga sp. 17 mud 1-3]AWM86245.1 AraC family transcriptional regulator [Microvirga sp. 17 mud 1-3]
MGRSIASANIPDPSQPVSAQAQKIFADYHCETSEVDELEHSLSNFISPQTLIPATRAGPFHGIFQFHGTQELGIFDVRFGQKLSIVLPPQEVDERLNNIAFVMAHSGSAQLVYGRETFAITGAHGIFFSSGPKRALEFSEDCDARALVVDRKRLTEYCAKLLGRDLDERLDLEIGFPLDTGIGPGWLRTMQYIEAELSNPDSLVRHIPAIRQQLEHLVFTSLLFGHRHNYSEALLQPQSAVAPFYVKRAEAYMEAHFFEPLSLADISAHAGVSARSLQAGFQNYRNMTPMAFLRSIRLQKARLSLAAADPTASTVTEIALACGFSHMGEFSVAYRRAFNETPRETLLRRA